MDSGAQNDFYRDEKSQRPAQFDEKWDPDMTNRTQGSHIKISAAAFTSKVVGIGATIKAKVIRNRSASPSVNLNRGNSQFLDGPIPQHSRNNSMLSGSTNKLAAKDRFTNWISRIRDGAAQKIGLRKASKPFDPFAGARTGSQKQTQSNPQPDFSQLLGMDDRELQLESERRRANLGKTQSNSSLPPLGSLGLSFSTMKDVFADPVKAPAPNSNPFTDPIVQPKYPFGEPVSTPQPSMAKQNTYVADVRRSRGQSLDAGGALLVANTRPPSGEPVSRYPSSIAPSHDSYRDTVFSSFSANVRKGKGRSDPFDLERPELWQPPNSGPPNPRASGRPRGASISNVRGSNARLPPLTTSNLRTQDPSGYGQPRVVSQADASRNSNTGTYESKYSSGVSSLDAWGDPGPDLGPGSTNTSMRGNVSSNGGSQDFGRMGVGAGDVSPLSVDSGRENKNRVGTAMSIMNHTLSTVIPPDEVGGKGGPR
ncbi:hypothetical protein M7I_3381 [Glarea lozoyensis 74030]|uniref:Uncharacterized protein n=1 Tax=Glarea lozoyensis (strain ATCC 74030 / MF5533) TaxID=1104152 RepID=H0ELB9_GLAL7|nr:hypothetical protein M7I_3381 [Glarea lozoyensis 74030]